MRPARSVKLWAKGGRRSTEQYGAEDLENGGQNAGGAQGDDPGAHRRREVVGHVVGAQPEGEYEGDQKGEHQQPHVRQRHLHQLPEADQCVEPLDDVHYDVERRVWMYESRVIDTVRDRSALNWSDLIRTTECTVFIVVQVLLQSYVSIDKQCASLRVWNVGVISHTRRSPVSNSALPLRTEGTQHSTLKWRRAERYGRTLENIKDNNNLILPDNEVILKWMNSHEKLLCVGTMTMCCC